MKYHLGIDIGSISVNTVLIGEDRAIIEDHYTFCHGKPFHVVRKILSDVMDRHAKDLLLSVSLTGTGGKLAAELIGGQFVNEIVAQSSSVGQFYPDAKTVIEMGGEDSKLIIMKKKPGDTYSRIEDFAMNNICAAGTGSFLDQQARRIGISIVDEFGALAMKSTSPPRIAGRCSVFAKSDMIHLQQIATPVEDIVAGLCFAVARNFKSSLARGKKLDSPVVFQGGVAANQGVTHAFREILGLSDGSLIIPEHHASMGAIGAVFHNMEYQTDSTSNYRGLDPIDAYLSVQNDSRDVLEPLAEVSDPGTKDVVPKPDGSEMLDVYLGLDVGSLSTNVVLIDSDNNVIARRYLPTASRPLEAIRRGMTEIEEEVGGRIAVRGAGTTGSGRYLTGRFIGADTIENEITAQATAAIAYDPTVDTIFEIGGQDSKFISIKNGLVVDFEMNKVCAAGTGSFLEEQAEKLDISIINDFQNLALTAEMPARLGDRCTVFMESDLNAHQQKGVEKENLVAGLAYSIVHNYLQKVVGEKKVGERIFFQGGVTNNRAVVSAFEKVTGKSITVPPHFDVTGAIGAAMLAREAVKDKKTTAFKGFDVSRIPYTVGKFTCGKCANQCEIRRVQIEGEDAPLFFGDRCDGWAIAGKPSPERPYDLFQERVDLLMGDYEEEQDDERLTVGIPRALMVYYGQFPYWRGFFESLGFRVVLSRPTDRGLITTSLEILSAETCFPVEVLHGHVHDLLEQEVDYVFLPFIITSAAEESNPTVNYNCPWIQTYPFMLRGAYRDDPRQDKFLTPTLHFRYGPRVLGKQLRDFMSKQFKTSASRIRTAMAVAERMQNDFEVAVAQRGAEVLANLPEGKTPAVILGRPYNTCDPELNLGLVEKLKRLNVEPIPVDYLPLGDRGIFTEYPMMYWPNGQKIISAARIVGSDPQLNAVYLGNFRCGPDSFISHYVRDEMKGKPYLQLEIDEHSADAGMITRCEAFLDSLKGYRKNRSQDTVLTAEEPVRPINDDRILYFPYMCDQAYAMAAASRSFGIKSEVLPMQNETDIALGRENTSSKECFPMICTTGSFIKKLKEPGCDPAKTSFFMPNHNGPCRFGQYNKLQRIVFDRLGFTDAEIISPGNDTAYEDLSRGHGNKYRINAWKGIVAIDILRKLRQEKRPYETVSGETDRVYGHWLDQVVASIERGTSDLPEVLEKAAIGISEIKESGEPRKPVIAVVGEIFMRDNSFCNGYIIERLEALGAETVIAPLREWISYSTYRYWRDSVFKRDIKGLLKSKVQEIMQVRSVERMTEILEEYTDTSVEVTLDEMLTGCSPYIHKHYDGDPALALGASHMLVENGASGVVNILPFTCMPGTVITSVSNAFRADHDNVPWVNVSYDGQDDAGIETRLQAFMHQALEYAKRNGRIAPKGSVHEAVSVQ